MILADETLRHRRGRERHAVALDELPQQARLLHAHRRGADDCDRLARAGDEPGGRAQRLVPRHRQASGWRNLDFVLERGREGYVLWQIEMDGPIGSLSDRRMASATVVATDPVRSGSDALVIGAKKS